MLKQFFRVSKLWLITNGKNSSYYFLINLLIFRGRQDMILALEQYSTLYSCCTLATFDNVLKNYTDLESL